jgi:hypothetical protein
MFDDSVVVDDDEYDDGDVQDCAELTRIRRR